MVKGKVTLARSPKIIYRNEMAEAVREIAKAIRCREKQVSGEYRNLAAENLMSLANLLFVGILLILLFDKAQAPYLVATIGVVIFAGLYLFALWLMRREVNQE